MRIFYGDIYTKSFLINKRRNEEIFGNLGGKCISIRTLFQRMCLIFCRVTISGGHQRRLATPVFGQSSCQIVWSTTVSEADGIIYPVVQFTHTLLLVAFNPSSRSERCLLWDKNQWPSGLMGYMNLNASYWEKLYYHLSFKEQKWIFIRRRTMWGNLERC